MLSRINERGNTVTTEFVDIMGEMNRYVYDFDKCRSNKGWKQYDTDQDAHYFGIWVHIEDRVIMSYCEGDEIVTTCPTIDSLKVELEHMGEFYGEPPPAFTVASLNGCITRYYDTRPAVAMGGS